MTPRQELDAFAELLVPNLRAAFMAAIQGIVDNAIIAEIVRNIEAGNLEGAFRAVGFSDASMRPLTKAIAEAFEAGGILTGATFPKYLNTTNGKARFLFDVRNSRAEAYLRDHSSQLITRIADETRTNVQTILRQGMIDGRNPRNVALDIVGRIVPGVNRRVGGIVGLTPQQAQWVNNTRADLSDLSERYFTRALRDKRFDRTVRKAIESGQPLDAETIEKLVLRYKDNALKYRGETIARTEALQSLNASEYEAHKQIVEMGAAKANHVKRIWDSAGDFRVRYSHRAMDGQKVGIDEPFVSPLGSQLMYPGDGSLGADASEIINCRCRVRLKVDWLAQIPKGT